MRTVTKKNKPKIHHPNNNQTDRFISNRSLLNTHYAHHTLTSPLPSSPTPYTTSLTKLLFHTLPDASLLHLRNSEPLDSLLITDLDTLIAQYGQQKVRQQLQLERIVEMVVMDATGVRDDFYTNLIDWGDTGLVALALGRHVYLWREEWEGAMLLGEELYDVSCVKFASKSSGKYLAVGCEDGAVSIWDVEAGVMLRVVQCHERNAVFSCDWNLHVLTTGSEDSVIKDFDMRVRRSFVRTYNGHRGLVCGLRWSNDGRKLASGSVDNTIRIWEPSIAGNISILEEHTATIKALAWSPWNYDLLASGGGYSDPTIKLWNINERHSINTIHAGSQVTGIHWSPKMKEIVSTHGYQDNAIRLWKYPSFVNFQDLYGHTDRILHSTLSPDSTKLITASPDDTVRLWHIWPNIPPQRGESKTLQRLR